MDKIAGFSLSRVEPIAPPWLSRFPLVKAKRFSRSGWKVLVWGQGDLDQFIARDHVVVGYSAEDMANLDLYPLQNRGLLLEFKPSEVVIANDTLGMMPVYYGSKGGVPHVSTCEEAVIQALGGVTLGRGRLVSYLIFQCAVATLTLWNEIDKLYANSFLTVGADGSFRQVRQPPLRVTPMRGGEGVIPHMEAVLRQTVRRYTDSLGDVFLLLSHGHDSRLVLCHMDRPERVHARTFPLSHPAERAFDVVIARESARLMGVNDHGVLDMRQRQLLDYTRPSIEFFGSPLGAVQVYLYAVSDLLGQENQEWPVVTGMNGDEHAGVALRRSVAKLKESQDPADRFQTACYSWVKEWLPGDLDAALPFDWRSELKAVRDIWASVWEETEGDDLLRHAHLIHSRNRGSQYITYAWQACDLLAGGFVSSPYDDRYYLEFMYSLPHEFRMDRSGQVELFERYYPSLYPAAGLPETAYDERNTLDLDALRLAGEAALWPLEADGSKPGEDFFRPDTLAELYQRAASGDLRAYYLLNSVQPVAWAVDRGYVR